MVGPRKVPFMALVVVLGSLVSSSSAQSCFMPGECINSPHVGGLVVASKEDCLNQCTSTQKTCHWFTYYPETKYCQLLGNCTALDQEICPGCLSGQADCQTTDPTCWVNGECKGDVLHVQQPVLNRYDCLRTCKGTKGCNWFTFLPSSNVCILLSDCSSLDESCQDDCLSGEAQCEEEFDPETAWHMIIGGSSGSENLRTVELYNWQTGEQCYLADLPEAFARHTGAIFEGIPVVCGGTAGSAKADCYEYNVKINTWSRIQSLLTATSEAGSAVVAGQGWVIIGGNTLTNSQKLAHINQAWAQGPALPDRALTGPCVLQIRDNVTAILGGNKKPNDIVMYDWVTAKYSTNPLLLLRPREGSACAIIKGRDGFPRVAVVGGRSKGMEFWNPSDGSIETISNQLPSEEGASTGMKYSQVVPIKGGSEFLMYGGNKGSDHKGIWRYSVTENTWVRVGNTLVPRGGHVVLPITNVTCSTL